MTTDHSIPLTALDDDLYVELVSGFHVEPHTVSFPAVVDEHRRQGMWARPRFRGEAAEALAEWLNLMYPLDPDWYPLARFDGDTLLIIRTAAPELREIGLLKRPRSPASQLRITDGERIGTGFDGWPEHWILTDNRHGKPHWAVTRCP